MSERRVALDAGGGRSLVDLLDRIVDAGLVLDGDIVLTLAGVDLIRINARLLLSSVDTLTGHRPRSADDPGRTPPPSQVTARSRTGPSPSTMAPVSRPAPAVSPQRPVGGAPGLTTGTNGASSVVGTGGDRPGQAAPGAAGLVLMVVDIVRQLLERQALHRMDSGTLTLDQVERLGRALHALEQQVYELSVALGVHGETGTALTGSRASH